MEKIDPFLSDDEMAQTWGKSPRTIRLWKNAQGIFGKQISEKYRTPPRKPVVKVFDSKVWNNREWFFEMYVNRRMGIRSIARVIDRSYLATRLRLIHFGIPIRSFDISTRPTHPCFSAEWLEDNYELQGMSRRKCAAKAGVSPKTIGSWLVYFKFEMRDLYEQPMGERNPSFGKKCIIKKDVTVHQETSNASGGSGQAQT